MAYIGLNVLRMGMPMRILILIAFALFFVGVAVSEAEKRTDGLIRLNEPRDWGTIIPNEKLHQDAYFESGVSESGVSR